MPREPTMSGRFLTHLELFSLLAAIDTQHIMILNPQKNVWGFFSLQHFNIFF